MYAKSIRPSVKHDVQKERSAKRDDLIARPRRAQICERSELCATRMRKIPWFYFLCFFRKNYEILETLRESFGKIPVIPHPSWHNIHPKNFYSKWRIKYDGQSSEISDVIEFISSKFYNIVYTNYIF